MVIYIKALLFSILIILTIHIVLYIRNNDENMYFETKKIFLSKEVIIPIIYLGYRLLPSFLFEKYTFVEKIDKIIIFILICTIFFKVKNIEIKNKKIEINLFVFLAVIIPELNFLYIYDYPYSFKFCLFSLIILLFLNIFFIYYKKLKFSYKISIVILILILFNFTREYKEEIFYKEKEIITNSSDNIPKKIMINSSNDMSEEIVFIKKQMTEPKEVREKNLKAMGLDIRSILSRMDFKDISNFNMAVSFMKIRDEEELLICAYNYLKSKNKQEFIDSMMTDEEKMFFSAYKNRAFINKKKINSAVSDGDGIDNYIESLNIIDSYATGQMN